MAIVKICMTSNSHPSGAFSYVTSREEVLIGGSHLEIVSDELYITVRVPYGTNVLGSGKVLFTAPKGNVFYAVNI